MAAIDKSSKPKSMPLYWKCLRVLEQPGSPAQHEESFAPKQGFGARTFLALTIPATWLDQTVVKVTSNGTSEPRAGDNLA